MSVKCPNKFHALFAQSVYLTLETLDLWNSTKHQKNSRISAGPGWQMINSVSEIGKTGFPVTQTNTDSVGLK